MKQLRVAFPFYGDRLGGSHVSGILLAESLIELGVDVRFVLHVERGLEDGESVDSFLKSRGHEWVCLNQPEVVEKKRASTQEVQRRISALELPIRSYLHENAIDIVHTNCRDMNRSWVIPTKKAGVKHVWHARGLVGFLDLEPKLAAQSDILVPISDYVATSVPPEAQEKVLRINNPIPTPSIAPERIARLRTELMGHKEHFLVGLFSRLDQNRKNIRLFCNMVNRLGHVDGKPVKFIICGRGEPETMDMIRNICFSANDRLETLGFVDPVTDYMAAMDCIVAPAKEEPLGRTPLEASSVGVPTVALADGGHLETVLPGVNGILVHAPHSQAFAHAVKYVLKCGFREQMQSQNLQEQIAQLLSKYEPLRNAIMLKKRYDSIMGLPATIAGS